MIRRTGVIWLGLSALYLTLAGTVSQHEVATAVVLGGLTTLWAARIRSAAPRRLALSRAHLAPWARGLRDLAPATLRTGAALLRAALTGTSEGHAHRIPFLRGPEADPAESGRRASAVLLASLAPDSFVLRADPGHDGALIHSMAACRTSSINLGKRC